MPSPSPMQHLAARSSGPSLEDSFGALLLGTYFALMLYGLLVYQCFKYFRHTTKDAIINKIFVVCLLLVETTHSTICMHFCYVYLIKYASDAQSRRVGIWTLQIYPVINGLCICVSQCFYARRVYLVSAKYRLLVAIAVILSLAGLGFYMAATAIAFIAAREHKFLYDIWINRSSYATTVVADVITTGVLVFNLKRFHTGVKRTDDLLDRLAMFALNTGLLIGITNILLFILSFFENAQLAFLGISMPATKLYANSVLAVLNARRSMAKKDLNPASTHVEFIGMSNVANNSSSPTRVERPQLCNIGNCSEVSPDGESLRGSRAASEIKVPSLEGAGEDACRE